MRLLFLSVASCLLSGAAFAGTVTETLSFAGSPSSGGDTVSGPVFDPALGTLTGVTMIATGSYTPHIFVGPAVTSRASILYVDLTTFGPGGGLTTVAAGNYNLMYNAGFLDGRSERFSETATVTNAQALSQIYTAFGPYKSGSLLGLDVFSKPATPGAWGSQADDLSDYAGSLAVTFTYTVPEPASLTLLGLGVATTLMLARPRRPQASGAA